MTKIKTDRNCLSYWFPRIRDAGLPVPRTKLVGTDSELFRLLHGKTPSGYTAFLAMLGEAARQIGYPCFLRTGHTSSKHEWEKTCYVRRAKDLGQHVFNLVEFSECCDLVGLPTKVWAVRELIPVVSAFRAFRGMPITREFRLFTTNGEFACIHPYWPVSAIRSPSVDDWEELLAKMSQIDEATTQDLAGLAERAARAVDGGSWSVDFLQASDGEWILTDMAEAERSWHWPDCKVAAAMEDVRNE